MRALSDLRWLVAEFCAHDLFHGWHIYLRDCDLHRRNADGSWGWIRRGHILLPAVHGLLAELGIAIRPGSDGTTDDGYGQLARQFPIRRSKRRGGFAVRFSGQSVVRA